MLKPLLLSGWFRVQPFLKYMVVVILIAPLVVASDRSSSAKQSQVIKITPDAVEPNAPTSMDVSDKANSTELLQANQINSLNSEFNSVPKETAIVASAEILQENNSQDLAPKDDLSTKYRLGNVEFAPQQSKSDSDSVAHIESASQQDLVQRLKSFKNQPLAKQDDYVLAEKPSIKSLEATNIAPTTGQLQAEIKEVPVLEHPDESSSTQQDPLGSPHPIPWTWIMETHKVVSANGGYGTRYYRSMPVISPDGKYAIYSRVQLEVKPEMYKSRVNSVLFIEDLKTKKLQVLSSTSQVIDPLLLKKESSSEQLDKEGKIGVLVPVSWSQKGDRFLARKFEGVFDTSDLTDRAVIWDQQTNRVNTVSPVSSEQDHEKIAVLLGWSKNQPDDVLFRSGEMGDEHWPLVQVAYDGKVNTIDRDQPVIFGQKNMQIWADPQVATR